MALRVGPAEHCAPVSESWTEVPMVWRLAGYKVTMACQWEGATGLWRMSEQVGQGQGQGQGQRRALCAEVSGRRGSKRGVGRSFWKIYEAIRYELKCSSAFKH